ncbi:response regulator [Actinoplanes sp. NPDC026670]|uniref:response regulator n=1 Tax=Actinoplanes sp. NPDC026670 TaxID=3154700 RepID=UPI00340C75A4
MFRDAEGDPGSVRVLDVLIVDDDAADTLMIEEALLDTPQPPAVHHVADGAEAMQYLRRQGVYRSAPRPDLILLDLNMPRMSGHEVLAEVKSDADLKRIPIVVLTTSRAMHDVTASYVNHANAYVTKPMDLDAFETAVRTIRRFYSDVAVLPADSSR